MTNLYTRDGRALHREGGRLFARSGAYVGRVKGYHVFGPTGSYAGTVVGDRVVYLPENAGRLSSPSAVPPRVGAVADDVAPAALAGDEPPFPD